MSKTVTLLKPFRFSPPLGESRLTKEVPFTPNKDSNGNWIPTEIDLPDDIAEHSWIKNDYADGAIERPEQTAKRAEVVAVALKKQQDDNAIQLAKAEQAMARAGASRKPIDTNDDEVQRQLNTPVNELKGSRGGDIDQPIDKDKTAPKAKGSK
jgi:hypothetical protein